MVTATDALALLVWTAAAVSAVGTVLWYTGRLSVRWGLFLAGALVVVGLALFMQTHVPGAP